MVRLIFLLIVAYSFSFSDAVDDKISSFVGQGYETKKEIINIVVGDKQRYINDDGTVDSVKLIKILKDNGFIKLTLKEPNNVRFTFLIDGGEILFLKIINNILNFMGFNYYDVKRVVKNGDGFSWSIVMNTEYVIDPIVLSEELKKRDCELNDVIKSDDVDWIYKVSCKNGMVLSKELLSDTTYKLKKPIKPYWISISSGKILQINSFSLNRWHPYICFLDKNLNILQIYKKNEKTAALKLEIPSGTKYIMVSDMYTLSNIRIGLKVYISSE